LQDPSNYRRVLFFLGLSFSECFEDGLRI